MMKDMEIMKRFCISIVAVIGCQEAVGMEEMGRVQPFQDDWQADDRQTIHIRQEDMELSALHEAENPSPAVEMIEDTKSSDSSDDEELNIPKVIRERLSEHARERIKGIKRIDLAIGRADLSAIAIKAIEEWASRIPQGSHALDPMAGADESSGTREQMIQHGQSAAQCYDQD